MRLQNYGVTICMSFPSLQCIALTSMFHKEMLGLSWYVVLVSLTSFAAHLLSPNRFRYLCFVLHVRVHYLQSIRICIHICLGSRKSSIQTMDLSRFAARRTTLYVLRYKISCSFSHMHRHATPTLPRLRIMPLATVMPYIFVSIVFLPINYTL
jgi:hypothetical protein